MNRIEELEFVFLFLLLFIVIFGLLARRIGTPYPIVMVIGGLLLGFVPGTPKIVLNPDVVFLVVLPPLLYAAAWTTSWREFSYNLVSISLLAFGLVGFTVAGVAFAAPHVFEGFDWRLGFALGAIVAPTDAIAATSIARRVRLPSRITDILEGESLINDATGLLALQFATAIVVRQETPTVSSGLSTFAWLTLGGIGIGLIVAYIADFVERQIDDGPIEITLSVLIPYTAYLAAEAVHASGVLSVVACGLLLSRKSASFFSPAVRIQAWAVWDSLVFVLNGVVFVLIGLQLPQIRASLEGYSVSTLILDGAIFSALLILLRLVWLFPGAAIANFIRRRIQGQDEQMPKARNIFIVGWTGMRGVVSLAAALALPTVLSNGSAFPQRDLIIFLTFCVIFVTLVLQGLTLPPLIRALGLAGADGPNCEEEEARRIAIEAVVSHLKEAKGNDRERYASVYDDISGHYLERLAGLNEEDDPKQRATFSRQQEITLEALRIERRTVIRLRDEGRINDVVLRRLEHELDLSESSLLGDDEEE